MLIENNDLDKYGFNPDAWNKLLLTLKDLRLKLEIFKPLRLST